MKTLRDRVLRGCKYLDAACAEIRRRFAFRPLAAAQRRKVQGQWFVNGIEIAGRAAECRETYARYLTEVPYTADEIREKASRVFSVRDTWTQLDLLAKQARDTFLIERAELHKMSMGVLKALEARARHPFLSEADRQAIEVGIHALRAELDKRNRKISETKNEARMRDVAHLLP